MATQNTSSNSKGLMGKGFKKLASMLDGLSLSEPAYDPTDKSAYAQYSEFADDEQLVTSKYEIKSKGKDGLSVELAVGNGTESVLEILVPIGVKAGEPVCVMAPDNRRLRVLVPKGHGPGDTLFVPVPKKAQDSLFKLPWATKGVAVESLTANKA